jgi:hypothetical protein
MHVKSAKYGYDKKCTHHENKQNLPPKKAPSGLDSALNYFSVCFSIQFRPAGIRQIDAAAGGLTRPLFIVEMPSSHRQKPFFDDPKRFWKVGVDGINSSLSKRH